MHSDFDFVKFGNFLASADGSFTIIEEFFPGEEFMAILLTCPSCDGKLKVKDDLVGRKVKCPKCRLLIEVPASLGEKFSAKPAIKEKKNPSRKKSPHGNEDVEGPLSAKKKKKSIFSADVGKSWQALNNFDVRRFTAAGWLLFVVSLAVGFVCIFPGIALYNQILPPDPIERNWKNLPPVAIAFLVGGLGTFFLSMGILRLLGIRVIRPKPSDPDDA